MARLFVATVLAATYAGFEATGGFQRVDSVFLRGTVVLLLALIYLAFYWTTRRPARVVCLLDLEAGQVEVIYSPARKVSLPISDVITMGMSVAYRDAEGRLVWLPLRAADFRP